MNNNLYDLVRDLSEAKGPTGFEQSAAFVALEKVKPLVDEAYIDNFGNVIGIRYCGKPNAKKIVLDAHLDEVGMIVLGYQNGYLRFNRLGGIDPRILINREVEILTNPPQFGIITADLPDDEDKVVPMKEMYIDVFMSEDEAKKAIPIGTPVSYKQSGIRLGENAFACKSLDDRSCYAVLLKTLEYIDNDKLDVDLYILGSVGEEIDSRGAITAVYNIAPEYAVAVDATFGKCPDCPDDTFKLGDGAVIGVGPNISNWIFKRMKCKAKELDMKLNVEVMSGSTGTNGWDMQVQRAGIATGILSIPIRYMHTPTEVLDMRDIESAAKLLAKYVENIDKECNA